MKKVLLGTSAIALAGAFTTSANAVEWDVKVGGYMEQYAAYSDSSVDGYVGEKYGGFDNKEDSEIHFLPSITLDNGIKISVDVQLEGNGYLNTSDTIDESNLKIDGSFGRIILGSENSAGYLMSYAAPDVTFLNVNSGSLTKFVPFSGTTVNQQFVGPTLTNVALAHGNDVFRGTLGSTYLENARNNDAQRFTYFTPRFAGFQLGVSYARDGNQDTMRQLNNNCFLGGGAPCSGQLHNIFDVGANYVNSFGGIDVALSGRWGIAANSRAAIIGSDFGENPQVWATGLNLGFYGVTVGGSFGEQNNAGTADGQVWDAGVSYETGPWGFSFTYMHGRNANNETFAGGVEVPGAFDHDETLKQYLLGVSYKLAKGVALNGYGAYVDFDEGVGDNCFGTGGAAPGGPCINPGGDDMTGWVVGTGIKVSF